MSDVYLTVQKGDIDINVNLLSPRDYSSPFVDVRNYSSFSAAIDSIGASEKTLLIPDEQAVTANKTVPSNVTLMFLQGGSLNISAGKTVTINGHLNAGLYQIFKGAGSVVFGTGSVEEVYPQWWSDADFGAKINSAIVAVNGTKSIIRLSQVTAYSTTISLDGKNKIIIKGDLSRLRYTGTGIALSLSNNTRWCEFYDLWIDCAVGGANEHDYTGLKIDTSVASVNKCRFKNVFIYGADKAIDIDGTNGFYFSVFEGIELYNFGSYGLKGTGTINANTFDFANIQEASATGVGIDLVGSSNRINVDNLSDLADGIIIDGYANRIRIGYSENIQANGGQAYTNKGNVNYLDFGYIGEGVKITSGAVKHENYYSTRSGYEYLNPRNKGLVGEWGFMEGTGTIVYDLSNIRNTMALTNTPSWVAGPQGYAVQFTPASSHYAQITANAAYDTDADFSMFLLFRIDAAAPGAIQHLFHKGLGAGNERMFIYYDTFGAIRFQVHNGAAQVLDQNLSLNMRFEGQGYGGFIPLVLTFDKSETLWKVYQGGYFIKNLDYDSVATVGGDIYLAAHRTPADYAPITIAKFAWYNRLLSQQEILELSNSYRELTETREYFGSAAPATGTWKVGDRIWDSTPSASGKMGWVCVTAGAPGTWETFGAIGDMAGSAVYDPPNLAQWAKAYTDVTVTGAALGDFAVVSFSLDLFYIQLTAFVSAADTVTCVFMNPGNVVDLASGTLRVRVFKQ